MPRPRSHMMDRSVSDRTRPAGLNRAGSYTGYSSRKAVHIFTMKGASTTSFFALVLTMPFFLMLASRSATATELLVGLGRPLILCTAASDAAAISTVPAE